jgi:DNA-binding NarL/FixJ family response regulator
LGREEDLDPELWSSTRVGFGGMSPVESRAERRIGVCLAAFLPFTLNVLQRRLANGPFRITSRLFEVDASGHVKPISVPPASVYVLEAHPVAATTEEAIAVLQEKRHRMRLIVLLERLDQERAVPLLRWGAKGLLDFLETIDQLPRAVPEVARGGFWVPRPILSRFVEETLTSKYVRRLAAVPAGRRLSTREREVRDLLLENRSNREIGEELNMSVRTVKFHVSNLLSKFGLKRRADLIVLAHTAGQTAEPIE